MFGNVFENVLIGLWKDLVFFVRGDWYVIGGFKKLKLIEEEFVEKMVCILVKNVFLIVVYVCVEVDVVLFV